MFNYRFAAMLAVISAILIFSAAPLRCQDESAPNTIDGSVASVDPQNFKITVKTPQTLVFSVTSGTKITGQDGLDMQLSDINIGNYVMVDYYDDRSGAHVAASINVEYNR